MSGDSCCVWFLVATHFPWMHFCACWRYSFFHHQLCPWAFPKSFSSRVLLIKNSMPRMNLSKLQTAPLFMDCRRPQRCLCLGLFYNVKLLQHWLSNADPTPIDLTFSTSSSLVNAVFSLQFCTLMRDNLVPDCSESTVSSLCVSKANNQYKGIDLMTRNGAYTHLVLSRS